MACMKVCAVPVICTMNMRKEWCGRLDVLAGKSGMNDVRAGDGQDMVAARWQQAECVCKALQVSATAKKMNSPIP